MRESRAHTEKSLVRLRGEGSKGEKERQVERIVGERVRRAGKRKPLERVEREERQGRGANRKKRRKKEKEKQKEKEGFPAKECEASHRDVHAGAIDLSGHVSRVARDSTAYR